MSELYEGLEFPETQLTLADDKIAEYIRAVEEPGEIYAGSRLAPPAAVAAFAMTALNEHMKIPAGSVHASQELDFLGTVSIGETVTCRSRVGRMVDRGKMRLASVDFSVENRAMQKVVTGRLTFMLPPGALE